MDLIVFNANLAPIRETAIKPITNKEYKPIDTQLFNRNNITIPATV
jgi:hypothetical protein